MGFLFWENEQPLGSSRLPLRPLPACAVVDLHFDLIDAELDEVRAPVPWKPQSPGPEPRKRVSFRRTPPTWAGGPFGIPLKPPKKKRRGGGGATLTK